MIRPRASFQGLWRRLHDLLQVDDDHLSVRPAMSLLRPVLAMPGQEGLLLRREKFALDGKRQGVVLVRGSVSSAPRLPFFNRPAPSWRPRHRAHVDVRFIARGPHEFVRCASWKASRPTESRTALPHTFWSVSSKSRIPSRYSFMSIRNSGYFYSRCSSS